MFKCPQCGSNEGLWRGVHVPGWEGVGPDLRPNGSDRGTEWSEAREDGAYGCGECEWEGFEHQLADADAPDPGATP